MRSAVLMYHRIADLSFDPFGLAISTSNFAAHMEVLHDLGIARPVAEASDIARLGNSDRPTIAVTFDDGYADNLHNAGPILKRFSIPATVFVTAGFVEGTRELYSDRLSRILFGTPRLPPHFELDLGEEHLEFHLRESAGPLSPEFLHDVRWRFWHTPPTPRHALLSALAAAFERRSHDVRMQVLSEMEAWAGDVPPPDPISFIAGCHELRLLANDPLIEIGAHTMTHPSLPDLPPDAYRREITESKEVLESITGTGVTAFAYPYGRHNADIVRAVREAGFDRAYNTGETRIDGDNFSPMEIPRFAVLNYDGPTFRRKLDAWLAVDAL